MDWFGAAIEGEGQASREEEEEKKKVEMVLEDQSQTDECLKYSSLYFWLQALRVAGQLQPSVANTDQTKVKIWMRRLFTTCILQKQQAAPDIDAVLNYRFDLLYDLDEYLLLHHSLAGNAAISVADIMLLSYLRRNLGLQLEDEQHQVAKSFFNMTKPLKCKNISRVIDHVSKAYKVGYASMDQKEASLKDQFIKLSSSGEFLEAVRSKNIAECERILGVRAMSIRSKERKGRLESAVHIACRNKDYGMLEFLRARPNVDFNMDDVDQESPLYEAIYQKNLEMVKYLVEKCGANIEHREIQNRSPLYYSCSVGALEIAQYLISAGADVNAITLISRTALSKACWNGQHQFVAMLLEHPQIDHSIGDSQGRTALHMAVWG